MAIVRFRADEMPPLSEERRAELRALAERPDSEIDYSEIPKATDFSNWMTAEEAKAYRAARRRQAAAV
jgi:ATP-dependent protease ClpP protease subunit